MSCRYDIVVTEVGLKWTVCFGLISIGKASLNKQILGDPLELMLCKNSERVSSEDLRLGVQESDLRHSKTATIVCHCTFVGALVVVVSLTGAGVGNSFGGPHENYGLHIEHHTHPNARFHVGEWVTFQLYPSIAISFYRKCALPPGLLFS